MKNTLFPVQSDDIVTVFISTDNARNVTAAVRQLPSWIHIRCFDHTLDLGIKDAKKGEKVIKTLLSKAYRFDYFLSLLYIFLDSIFKEQRRIENSEKEFKLFPSIHLFPFYSSVKRS